MAARYIAPIGEVSREMVRILEEILRVVGFGRIALTQMEDGRSGWEYPEKFHMGRAAGFWHPIASPRLEEKAVCIRWATFLGMPPERLADGGNDDRGDGQREAIPKIPDSGRTGGLPLTEVEHMARRARRPKSLAEGRLLRRAIRSTQAVEARQIHSRAEGAK